MLMLTFPYLLILLFSIYLPLDIVPLTSLKNLTINIDKKYSDSILNFSNTKLPVTSNYSIIIRMNCTFCAFNLYVYDDIRQLNSDIDDKTFQNYIQNGIITGKESYLNLKLTDDNNNDNNPLYFYFENVSEYIIGNINVSIFADGFSSTLKDSIIKEVECDGISNYIDIPANHKAYINFGFGDTNNFAQGILDIYEGKSNQVIKKFDFFNYIEDSYPLKNGFSYKIHFACKVGFANKLKKFFYISQSNYQKCFEAKIDTKYFQQFPVLTKSKIILDTTTLESDDKMIFEYNNYFTKNIQFNPTVNIINDEECNKKSYDYDKICKNYFSKPNLLDKYITLQVSNPSKSRYIFELRYRTDTFKNSFFFGILIGFAISSPNIILFILSKIYSKNIDIKCFHLFMDILFHLGCFNLITKFTDFGSTISFGFGIGFLILYFILFLCYHICVPNNNSTIQALKKRLKLNKTLNQAINENRELPPRLTIKTKISYEVSQEVLEIYGPVEVFDEPIRLLGLNEFGDEVVYNQQRSLGMIDGYISSEYSEWKRVDQGGGKLTYTQKNPKLEKGQRKEIKTKVSDRNTFKNHIFRYKSWQDETNFIINNNNDNFLDIKFVYEIKFDSSAEESIKKFKKEITDKEKSEGNRTEFEDIFDVPNFKENAFCVREKNYNKELIYLILGIIINLLGFSSFVNLFAKKEVDKIEIKILKSFSSSEQYKNKYDEHLKEYDNIKLKDDKNKFGYLLEPLIIKNPID